MQEFRVEKNFITLMKVSLIGCIAFMVFGMSLPFLPDDGKSSANGTLIVSLMCTALFGFFAALSWRTLKKLPLAEIAADDDGIWYLHAGKNNGLVTWEKIHKIKERQYLQRLDLMGSNNRELLRVEYQLHGFEQLREVLNEKACTQKVESEQFKFSKGSFYHLSNLVGIVCFSALGIYVGQGGNPLLGYFAMSVLVAVIIYEYLVTVTGIEVTSNGFKVAYPFTTKNISYIDVEDIIIADVFHKGNRIPEIWVITKNVKKPFKLKQLGTDSNVIYKVLRNAVKL